MLTPDVTPPLDDFLREYEQDDNCWWRIPCGDHLNLFEAAVERMQAAERRLAALSPSETSQIAGEVEDRKFG
jgi:hypothetical protein